MGRIPSLTPIPASHQKLCVSSLVLVHLSAASLTSSLVLRPHARFALLLIIAPPFPAGCTMHVGYLLLLLAIVMVIVIVMMMVPGFKVCGVLMPAGCVWCRIIPGRFLMCCYPGDQQEFAARSKLAKLLDAGIRAFVSLLERPETKSFVNYEVLGLPPVSICCFFSPSLCDVVRALMDRGGDWIGF